MMTRPRNQSMARIRMHLHTAHCIGSRSAEGPSVRAARHDDKNDPMAKMQLDAKGHGEPVVLVGGGLTGWESWIPHQQRLAASRQAIRANPIAVQYGLE